MSAQTTNALLKAKLGNRLVKAHDQHKDDDTKLGNAELPDGIENGIAQLVEIKVAPYENGDNKGELYFYAAGVVKTPRTHNGIPVEGLRTSLIEPLYDTPTRARPTAEAHMGWLYAFLRSFGIDTTTIGPDDLGSIIEALKEDKPHFRFRTWKGKKKKKGEKGYNPQYDGPDAPEPRVKHDWLGRVSYTEDADAAAPVQDASPPSKPTNGKPHATAAPAKAVPKKPPEPEPVDPEELDGSDLDSLLTRADAGDTKAQGSLRKLAGANGLDLDEFDAIPLWSDAVEMIRNSGQDADENAPGDDEGEGDGGEEEAASPEVGDRYLYAPLHKTTKKPLPAVEIEITHVGEDTVDAFQVAKPTVRHKAIPWDQLGQTD